MSLVFESKTFTIFKSDDLQRYNYIGVFIMTKKLYLISCLIILLISITAVSAEDLNSTDTALADETALDDSLEITADDDTLTATRTVSGSTFADIQKSVDNAQAGDTIKLSGTYTGSGSMIKINKTLTIEGNGATLDAKDSSKIFEITGTHVTVNNIVFKNGHDTSSGAIDWWSGSKSGSSDLYGVLSNCRFIDCNADFWAGAVYLSCNKVTVTDCYFENNEANYGGALKINGEGCVVKNCKFTRNIARNDGGAIHADVESDTIITNCTFSSNYAKVKGGAVYTKNKDLTISKSSFTSNTASNGNNYYGEASSNIAISTCTWSEGNINDYSTLGLAGEYTPITLIETAIEVPAQSGFVNSNQVITATVRDASNNLVDSGTVEFTIGGKIYTADVKNGKASVTVKLTTFGSIAASAKYLGNGKYDSTSPVNFKLTSDVNHVKFSASSLSTYYNSGEKFNVKVISQDGTKAVANVKVTAKVYTGTSTKTYTATSNSNGIAAFNIPNLAIGNHKVVISSADAKSAVASQITSSIKISKLSATLTPTKLSTTYGSGKYFQIKVINSKTKKVACGVKLNLRIYTGPSYKTVTVTSASNGYAKYAGSLLSVGTHKIVVSAKESKYVAATAKTSSVKVSKATLVISAPKVTNEYQKSQTFKVTVKNKQTKAGMKGVTVAVKVYTDSSYKTFNVKTDSNGVATINTKSLSKTAHNVVVSVAKTGKYNAASAKSKITITKVKLATTITIEDCYKTSNGYFIKACLKDSTGKALAGKEILIKTIMYLGGTASDGGTISATTDSNGYIAGGANMMFGGITEYDITAIFAGDDSYCATTTSRYLS